MTKESTVAGSDLMAFVLRLIELLRPRFYNRITWLVVAGGLAMMSTRLWEALLNAFLEKEFDLSVSGTNDAGWGFALCVLGLLYHMANTGFYDLIKRKESLAQRRLEIDHDKRIFQEANEILKQEVIEDFIDVLQCDHSYYMDKCSHIENFVRYLALTNNHFLTPALLGEARNVLEAWSELGQFLSYKFFVYPSHQTEPPYRLCMQPCWNMDRDGHGAPDEIVKYDNLTDELRTLTETFVLAYRRFRKTVKSELVI